MKKNKSLICLLVILLVILIGCNSNSFVEPIMHGEDAFWLLLNIENNFLNTNDCNQDINVQSFISHSYAPCLEGETFDVKFEIYFKSHKTDKYLIYEINNMGQDYYSSDNKPIVQKDFIIPIELFVEETDTIYLEYTQKHNDFTLSDNVEISYKKRNNKIKFYDYIGKGYIS